LKRLPRCLTLSGISILACALFYLLALLELRESQACALTVALLLLGLLLLPRDQESSLPWVLASLCALASTWILLPLAGAKLTSFSGLFLLAWGLALELRRARKPMLTAWGQPLLWALAAGASVAWARCLSLLLGSPFYAFGCLLSALALGAGLGRLLARRLRQETAAWALAMTGLLGILIPHFLRFLGINSGAARYLHLPLGSLWDIFFIAGQAWLALAAWATGLSLAQEASQEAPGRAARDALAPSFSAVASVRALPRAARDAQRNDLAGLFGLAGPACALALIPRIGPAGAAALFGLLILAHGLLKKKEILGPWTAALLLACAWLSWMVGDPFKDIWITRLNSAYPGGEFLALREDGDEALGVYRFSPGTRILLRNGFPDFKPEEAARRQAHLPLLMLPSPRKALLVQTRHPMTLSAALSHQVEVTLLDPHPALAEILKAQAEGSWELPRERFTWVKSPLRRFLRGPVTTHPPRGEVSTYRGDQAPQALVPSPRGGDEQWGGGGKQLRGPSKGEYDLILLELPAPAYGPRAAFQTTRESLRALRERLAPGGILAVRIPLPIFEENLKRLLRAAQGGFPHSGLLKLPGCLLLLASEQPLETSPRTLLSRIRAGILIDDFSLPEEIRKGLPWVQPGRLAEGSSQTDDRAPNAFPLSEILLGRPLLRRLKSPLS